MELLDVRLGDAGRVVDDAVEARDKAVEVVALADSETGVGVTVEAGVVDGQGGGAGGLAGRGDGGRGDLARGDDARDEAGGWS